MAGKHGPLVGSLDQGTSSSRFLVFAANNGELLTYHQIEIPRSCPKEGWVEQDAKILLNSTLSCVDKTVENLRKLGVDPSDIKAIGITNQRETIIAWDKLTGEPLYNAIVWLDTRTASEVDEILGNPTTKAQAERIRRLCGLPMSTYFSALKMKWMLEKVPAVKSAVEEDRCLLGTVDSWLLWNLTGGKADGLHLTDVTNASRTMLMNIETLQWDPYLCNYFKIPMKLLPAIRSSSEIYGHMSRTVLTGVPISGILGDQQAALVGQMCFKPGQAKCTYGTGCFLLFNTGNQIVNSAHGLLTTVGYKLGPNKPTVYALEGSVAVAGASIRWLRDNLGLGKSYEELSDMANSVPDSGGVYFVPAFSGLFAPYWRPDARGIICGLTEHSTKGHIARASYEAVAFQVKDVLEAMNQEGGHPLTSLRVDGGMTISDSLMQLQSDILGIDTVRPSMSETTALGAAMAAGSAEGINVWDINSEDYSKIISDVFEPKITQHERDERYWRWKEAVKRSCGWEVHPDQKKPADKRYYINRSIPVSLYFIGTFALLVISAHMSSMKK
ncbi:glycerol kinase isoform X2 [Folsomia candida]|uniref:Probable glycerol kinase n=1 Tax=Folsomia candida TaxID=158441 RepID=A0A226EVP3_FOLCA|nr:glycerol kinase isoform X2 [Folsomia candida]OXA60911.1 Glycerol kinase [Folsomia candida]